MIGPYSPTEAAVNSKKQEAGSSWSYDEALNDILERAEHAKRPTRARWRGHLVRVPRRGVSGSRRANAARWRLSMKTADRYIHRMAAEGHVVLVEPKCSKFCRGARHEHTSVIVAPPARILSEANPLTQYETTTDLLEPFTTNSVLEAFFRLKVASIHVAPALIRLVSRVGNRPDEIARGLRRVWYSSFLRGKRPGRSGAPFRPTGAWLLDHFERIARGDFDDRGRFGSPPPDLAAGSTTVSAAEIESRPPTFAQRFVWALVARERARRLARSTTVSGVAA